MDTTKTINPGSLDQVAKVISQSLAARSWHRGGILIPNDFDLKKTLDQKFDGPASQIYKKLRRAGLLVPIGVDAQVDIKSQFSLILMLPDVQHLAPKDF